MLPTSTTEMRRLVAVVSSGLVVSGCMHARTEESREMPTKIEGTEAVVVLAKPQLEGAGSEDKFMDCVSHKLAQGSGAIRVQGNNDFVDRLYPWFEPGTAPTRPEAVAAVLSRPGVSEVVAATGV